MKKSSKKFSDLAKRTIALAVCFAALAQGSVFAASSAYSRTAGRGKKIIEQESAIDSACGDLGIGAEEAEIESAEVVLEDGRYVYKISLVYEGTEYIYNVNVFDGEVVKVTTPSPAEEPQTEEKTDAEENTGSSMDLNDLEDETADSSANSSHRYAGVGKIISRKEAIDYACKDLGIESEAADVKSAAVVFDGGQYVYQVCFVYDGVEYTYNIRVYNGAVVKRTFTSAGK